MKKYRLLKDLPEYPAGTLFECVPYPSDESLVRVEGLFMVANEGDLFKRYFGNNNWFEEIKDEPKKEFKRWRAGAEKSYYFIDCFGDVIVSSDIGNVEDDHRYKIGNYYSTKEEAQKALDKQLLLQELKDFQMEIDEGWRPDWYDEDDLKFFILMSGEGVIYTDYCSTLRHLNPVYFGSVVSAQAAIDHFGDRLKLLFE